VLRAEQKRRLGGVTNRIRFRPESLNDVAACREPDLCFAEISGLQVAALRRNHG
jgi:hypothetical protein